MKLGEKRILAKVDVQAYLLTTSSAIASLAVFLLFMPIAHLGRYTVTAGSILCGFCLASSVSRISFEAGAAVVAAFSVIYPLALMATFGVVNPTLIPETSQFISSYALWSISILTLYFSWCSAGFPRVYRPGSIAAIILFLCGVQFIGARFFSWDGGFSVVQPFVNFDIFHSYLNLGDLSAARAIGMYYEPSMCGRVLGTLALILYLRTGRVIGAALVLLAGIVLTQSVGLLVLSIVMLLIVSLRSARRSALWVSGGLLAFAGPLIILAPRLLSWSDRTSSNYIRIAAPLDTVVYVLLNHPFGVPIGSAEKLASVTGFYHLTGESKVTNGTYEFLFYFGLSGVVMIYACIFCIVAFMFRKNTRLAIGLSYLFLSNAISGSFLSLESSLLTGFLISECRCPSRRRRFQINVAKVEANALPLSSYRRAKRNRVLANDSVAPRTAKMSRKLTNDGDS